MKKLTILFQAGEIVGHSGAEVSSDWNSTYISGNGWYVNISPNGTIQCVASAPNGEGKRNLKKVVILPSRWAKITFKKGDCIPQLVRKFKIKEWPFNGTIELCDGQIENRGVWIAEE